MSSWTLYYWGWWLSWSPFVGIFIARVSKGRSIREFIAGVLLVPALVSFVWFSVFGVLGIETGKKNPELFDMTAETQLFGVFNEIPLGIILSIIALVLIASFFITSADSATFVLGMQTTNGSLEPSIMIMISFYKDANQERKFLGLTLTPNKHRLQDYVQHQQEDYEDDIIEKRTPLRDAEKAEK